MSDETEDWYIPWEEAEVRPREPANFAHEKCDGCWDMARVIAEIPRSRRVGLNDVEMQAARFRLCSFHADKLRNSDSLARIYPLKGHSSE